MGEYSGIKKIWNGEFSWREDFEQTEEHIDSAMRGLNQVYRKIGLDRLTKSSERILGPLDEKQRAYVTTGYVLGTTSLGLGIALSPIFYIPAGAVYAATLIHHNAMRQDRRATE